VITDISFGPIDQVAAADASGSANPLIWPYPDDEQPYATPSHTRESTIHDPLPSSSTYDLYLDHTYRKGKKPVSPESDDRKADIKRRMLGLMVQISNMGELTAEQGMEIRRCLSDIEDVLKGSYLWGAAWSGRARKKMGPTRGT
jgi:hypothetical protein